MRQIYNWNALTANGSVCMGPLSKLLESSVSVSAAAMENSPRKFRPLILDGECMMLQKINLGNFSYTTTRTSHFWTVKNFNATKLENATIVDMSFSISFVQECTIHSLK